MKQRASVLSFLLPWLINQKVLAISASNDAYCDTSPEIEEQCASYCYESVKPFLHHTKQLMNQIESNDQGNQILELQKKLQDFSRLEQKIDLIIKSQEEEKVEKKSREEAFQEFSIRLEQVEKTLSNHKEQNQENGLIRAENCEPFGNSSGIHQIWAPVIENFQVRCESNAVIGNGWLVIQRRFNGTIDYNTCRDLTHGFGNLSEDFWLGTEKLYHLTNHQQYELHVKIINSDGKTEFAHYKHFIIESKEDDYKVKFLKGKTGTDGEILKKVQSGPNGYWPHGIHGALWAFLCKNGKNPNGNIYKEKKIRNWLKDRELKSLEMLIRPPNLVQLENYLI